MSLTINKSINLSEKNIPVAKLMDENKIIFLLPDSDEYQQIPSRNLNKCTYTCPYCKKIFTSKTVLIGHLTNYCQKKKIIIMQSKALINAEEGDRIVKLPLSPLDHEVIVVTGMPKCGKTFWINEYVNAYIQLYKNTVFLITRNKNDDTISKDINKYIVINVDDEMLKDLPQIQDFANSLVIFDDIESSSSSKCTEKMYSLMSDIAKNGRHYNITLIFSNQECRMGVKTKPILACTTGFVIFPKNCALYQMRLLLKEHMGYTKKEIEMVLDINSRWVYLNRSSPQYVISDKSIFMMGKQLYVN